MLRTLRIALSRALIAIACVAGHAALATPVVVAPQAVVQSIANFRLYNYGLTPEVLIAGTRYTYYGAGCTDDGVNCIHDSGGHAYTRRANSLDPPTPSTRGGVYQQTAPSGQFANGVNGDGTLAFALPSISSLGGSLLCTQLPVFTGDVVNTNCATHIGSINGGVSVAGITGLQGNGAKLQLSTGTTTNGDLAKYDVNGNVIDSGSASAPAIPGGTSGQTQYNNSGALGGYTMGGDCTLTVPNIICLKSNGTPFGTFATQNYATPPAIGGTTPNTGAFSALSATSGLTVQGLNGGGVSSLLVNGTMSPSSSGQSYGAVIAPLVSPTGASTLLNGFKVVTAFGGCGSCTTGGGFVGINETTSQLNIDSSWVGPNPIPSASEFNPATVIDAANVPITNFQEYGSTGGDAVGCDGFASITTTCTIFQGGAWTGAAGANGTLNLQTASFQVPQGAANASGSTVNNIGIKLTGSCPANIVGTTTCFAIYDSSTAPIYIAGSILAVDGATISGGVGLANPVALTDITGSTQCLHVNSAGTIAGTGGDCGTVATTGSPANGNLAKFSGANTLTNGDLSGDASTSGTLAVTVTKLNNNTPGNSCATHQFEISIDTSARGSCAQPTTADVSGLAAIATSGLPSDLQDQTASNGDSNYSIPATVGGKTTVGALITAPFTAPRTWTFPDAATFKAGHTIPVLDTGNFISPTNSLTLAVINTNTYGGWPLMQRPGSVAIATSDGVSKWTFSVMAPPSQSVDLALDFGGRVMNQQGTAACTLTASSTAVSCASNVVLTAADVGDIFAAQHKGAAGAEFTTTIASLSGSAPYHAFNLTAAPTFGGTTKAIFQYTVVAPGSGYKAPGNGSVQTLSGGTALVAGLASPASVTVVAANIRAGGTGGATGACTATLAPSVSSELNGVQATISGTVSGGALQAGLTVVTGATYTSLTGYTYDGSGFYEAIPVTGCGLVGATVDISFGLVDESPNLATGVYQGNPPCTNSSAAATTSNDIGTGATLKCKNNTDLVSFGYDNSATVIPKAITYMNAMAAAATPVCLNVNGTFGASDTLPTASVALLGPAPCVRGRSTEGGGFYVFPHTTGSVLHILNANNNGGWGQSGTEAELTDPTHPIQSGLFLENLTFWGDQSSDTIQHGITLYGQTAWFNISHIYGVGLNGTVIGVGADSTGSGGISEGYITDLRLNSTGAPNYPAIDLASIGSGAGANEIRIFGVRAVDNGGPSLGVRPASAGNGAHNILIVGFKQENSGEYNFPTPVDFIDLGEDTPANVSVPKIDGTTVTGSVEAGIQGIDVLGSVFGNETLGGCAVRVKGLSATDANAIRISGSLTAIGPAHGKGICIQAAQFGILVDLTQNGANDSQLVVHSTPNAGQVNNGAVEYNGHGTSVTTSIDAGIDVMTTLRCALGYATLHHCDNTNGDILDQGSAQSPVNKTINCSGTPAADACQNVPAANLTGTLPGGRMPALTGDVTSSAGTTSTTIANSAVSNAKMANAPANTVKGNPTGGSAAEQDVTAATARSSSLLNIDGSTTPGAADYTILSTDRTVITTSSFSFTPHTWTLPAANSVNPGQELEIADLGAAVSSSGTLTIARAGSDTIGSTGVTSLVWNTAGNSVRLKSDGTSKWAIVSAQYNTPAVSHKFFTAYAKTTGFTQAQPAAADVTGLAAVATSGSASDITTGTLPAAQLPNPGASSLGGVKSASAASHNFQTGIDTSGNPTFAQPAAADVTGLAAVATSGSASDLGSGTLPAGRLPNPSSSSLGGVQSIASVSHIFLKSISTSGVPSGGQPACTDLSDVQPGCNQLFHPGYIATRWYVPKDAPTQAAAGAHIVASNTLYCYPGNILQKITIDRLGVKVTTIGSSNVQLAVYASNTTDGLPDGAPLVSTGNIVDTGTGSVNATVSQQLAAGSYWWCSNTNDITAVFVSAAVSVTGPEQSMLGSTGQAGALNTATLVAGISFANGGSFGTWPTVSSGTTWTDVSTATIPLLEFRVGSIP